MPNIHDFAMYLRLCHAYIRKYLQDLTTKISHFKIELKNSFFFEVKKRHPHFFTNNMIFLECGVIALFKAVYMFRDHNHVKMKFCDVI